MASDDEDEELKALRLAVLLSMKKKVDKEASPKKKTDADDLNALRDAALKTIESAGVKPLVPQPIPTATSSPSFITKPYQNKYDKNFNVSNAAPRGRPCTSNLIVINPAPVEPVNPTNEKPQQKPVLLRPQDKWHSPNTNTQTVEEPKKVKAPSKFSRYDSSDSESSDSSSSDSDSEEEQPVPSRAKGDSEDEKLDSPKNKSESEKSAITSDSSSDSDSDDVEKQIDNILNSPEIKDKKILEKPFEEKVLKAKTIDKVVPLSESCNKDKVEVKSIPALIGTSKSSGCKKVSNAWSDSDSDSGIKSGKVSQKAVTSKSWSDQDSSDEVNNSGKNTAVTKNQPNISEVVPQKSKAEIEKEKEDRRRMIENDLQKTLKALQSIKEKRLKQEATQKGSKDSKRFSPPKRYRDPRRSSSSNRSISPRRRRSPASRKSSPRRRRSLSPRRRRSPVHRRSSSRSPGRRRSPLSSRRRSRSPGLRRRSPTFRRSSSRSPVPRRRKSPLAFKQTFPRSPNSKRSPNTSQLKTKSPSRENRVLTSEEKQKIEARRKKFESSSIEVKKTVSLKNIIKKSDSKERSRSPKITSPKDRSKPPNKDSDKKDKESLEIQKKDLKESRRKSRESIGLKEENNDSDVSKGSVSSLSDSESDDEDRSWRKEQNKNKPKTDVQKTVLNSRPRHHHHDRPREDRFRRDGHDVGRLRRPIEERGRNDRPKDNKTQIDPKGIDSSKDDKVVVEKKNEEKGSKSAKPGKVYRSDSHVFSDNIDRGFDASNYRKTKIDSGVASGESDSDFESKDKKLISVILPSDSKQNSPANVIISPARKVECSDIPVDKSSRKRHKHRSERHKNKRVVITDEDDVPHKKKLKVDQLGDARNLLQAIKSNNDGSRRAVIRNDGISVLLPDKSEEPDSPRKPSVHERLGRKVPSLMSIKTEELHRVRSPEISTPNLQISTREKDGGRESKRSKDRSSHKLKRSDSSEKKSKKKRSIIQYDSPEEGNTGDTGENDNALEKRIQIIKEKNAAILKRQAEIQKDKERFG